MALDMAFEGYGKRVQQQAEFADSLNHILGRYIAYAFNAPKKYPRKPYLATSQDTMSTDIESALQKIAERLGAKHGNNTGTRHTD